MARKLVLITGATRGLGRAMVEEFARLGHTVVGCGRSHKDVAALRRQFSAPHDFYEVDVASDEEVKSWASLLLTSHGACQIAASKVSKVVKGAALSKSSRMRMTGQLHWAGNGGLVFQPA